MNWNGKDMTLDCLSSLGKVSTKNADLEVIVVDNGSQDGSVEAIQKFYPKVHCLPTGANLGFTGGNNFGIKDALTRNPDYIWLLNNDTIVDPDVLSFVSAFEDPKVGVVGSKIYFAPGYEFHKDRYSTKEKGKVFWFAGGLIDWKNIYFSHRGVDEVDHGQFDSIEETPFVTGCSFVIRTDIVKKIGMLDDRYYLYLEDADWCLRVQKNGDKTLYYPPSIVWHRNAASSGTPGNPRQDYYLTRNRFFLGFRYAKLRTKFALFRQAIRYIWSGPSIRRKAAVDVFTGRLGRRI